jgi:hypothetical protein
MFQIDVKSDTYKNIEKLTWKKTLHTEYKVQFCSGGMDKQKEWNKIVKINLLHQM